MALTDNLKKVISEQKELLSSLEKEVDTIASNDLTRENDKLKEAVSEVEASYNAAQVSLSKYADENARLKNALYEQIYNEKVTIIQNTQAKIQIYFDKSANSELDRLTELENHVKERINAMLRALHNNMVDASDEIYKKLDDISKLLGEKIYETRNKIAAENVLYEKEKFDALKNEQITDEQLAKKLKKNNIESFVGLNLLNKLGVLLIIIGVITASQYTYFKLSDMMKGIMLFALGGGALAAGELLNRKKPNVFSIGITSGGVAILYIALALSYFNLRILGMYPALMLCVLVTAAAFLLSVRYNSQTVAAFALIGGYIPIFSIAEDNGLLYSAMVYFVILNLFALFISFNKKWSVSAYIGLFFNIGSTSYIAVSVAYDLSYASAALKLLPILFTVFAFLIYTLIPIISTFRTKQKFKRRDTFLVAVNTFFSSVIMYVIFDILKLSDFNGTLAIIFAVLYMLLGKFLEEKLPSEKNTQALFYLTGFAFVVLIIPLQFEKEYLSLGWLAEGVAVLTYGIIKEEKSFKRGGMVINILCLFVFIVFDLFYWKDALLFPYKYLAVTLGSIIILGAYIYKKTLYTPFQKFYSSAVIINIWFYMIYLCNKLNSLLKLNTFSTTYLTFSLAVALTFAIAYIAPRIKALPGKATKIISNFLYIVGILWLFVLTSSQAPAANMTKSPPSVIFIGSLIIVIISMLAVFAINDMLKRAVLDKKLKAEWYPLILSSYFVVILTQNLIAQYNLSFASIVITLIYVVTALLWIIFGFMKRYSYIRRFGLCLAIAAVIKIFLIDFAAKEGSRIISYFSLGVVLIIISFIYQKFTKRLEASLVNESNEKYENNENNENNESGS